MADEIRIVKHAAAQHNVVFVLGHAHAVLPKDLKFWQLPRRLLLEMPYKVCCACQWCCHDVCAWSSTVPAWHHIPYQVLCQLYPVKVIGW